MTTKSEKLEQKLAELREQITVAKKAEQKADRAELLRLVERAECLPEALAWARARAGRQPRTKQIKQEVQ